MRKKIPALLAVLVAALMSLGAALVFVPSASALEAMFVDIHAEMDLPHVDESQGPKTYAATQVQVGAGLELSALDETANPSGWIGDIAVDVDDSEGTITVSADEDPGNFTVIDVSLATAAINTFEFATLELVSDDLLEGGTPAMLNFGVVDGEITLSWDVGRDMDNTDSLFMTGSAVFTYTTAQKDTPAATTLEWDVYIGCTEEDLGVPFNFSMFRDEEKMFDFDETTPFNEGGEFITGDFKVVIDAGEEYQLVERFIRVREGRDHYFAFPILPVGMSSDCIADEEETPEPTEAPEPTETPTPTETSAPPAETMPTTTPPAETEPAETTPGTTSATTPASNPATKSPVLAVTGAGSQPFLLMGALLMGGGALLLLNRTLRSRKH